MKSKSEIFNSHKTMVDGKEVLTYGNAIKAMDELEAQSYDEKGRKFRYGSFGITDCFHPSEMRWIDETDGKQFCGQCGEKW